MVVKAELGEKVTFNKRLQPLKALSPIVVTLAGSITEEETAEFLIVVKGEPDKKVTSIKLSQLPKALPPIVVKAEPGEKVTSVKLLRP